jgi:hypothetical protein
MSRIVIRLGGGTFHDFFQLAKSRRSKKIREPAPLPTITQLTAVPEFSSVAVGVPADFSLWEPCKSCGQLLAPIEKLASECPFCSGSP